MTRESDDFDPGRRGLTAITASFMVGLLFVCFGIRVRSLFTVSPPACSLLR
ncbi:hypothetical protein [Leclercia adecarboxylata]|jgi:hypothetical protein|uniref:hypothetical protein n=1 Tax=Leclercia adecarboxylata TaxID=83655 RepID=UPI000A961A4A|nr:hypothetical protein [Leclercia adecarboxylata]